MIVNLDSSDDKNENMDVVAEFHEERELCLIENQEEYSEFIK